VAHWSVEYRHPTKGWLEVKKLATKEEAEYFVKHSSDSIIIPDDSFDRFLDKFRFKKLKGNLK
jgi:hypothetical protein